MPQRQYVFIKSRSQVRPLSRKNKLRDRRFPAIFEKLQAEEERQAKESRHFWSGILVLLIITGGVLGWWHWGRHQLSTKSQEVAASWQVLRNAGIWKGSPDMACGVVFQNQTSKPVTVFLVSQNLSSASTEQPNRSQLFIKQNLNEPWALSAETTDETVVHAKVPPQAFYCMFSHQAQRGLAKATQNGSLPHDAMRPHFFWTDQPIGRELSKTFPHGCVDVLFLRQFFSDGRPTHQRFIGIAPSGDALRIDDPMTGSCRSSLTHLSRRITPVA